MFAFVSCTSDHTFFFVLFTSCSRLVRLASCVSKRNVKSTAGAAMSALHRQ